TPYVVDEDLIQQIALSTNVITFREKLGIAATDIVFVFCAKFIDRKRPMDAIEAFAKINNENASLIMIGTGPLLEVLQKRIDELGLKNKVIFPGIVKYSELASYYTASNVLVFCSNHEPYGLPVNEAMICGIPVIVSDRIGARLDLVDEGITGWIYPSANVESLAAIMQEAINTKDKLPKMGKAAQEKMKHWDSNENVNRQLDFFKAKHWLAIK
ncbi:MAG: glycosyltransferase family 4 protein, partial [Deinococcales bacterium]|nr:glycosyltransferase family 4 protein [Chitinophagaceae bacterium]